MATPGKRKIIGKIAQSIPPESIGTKRRRNLFKCPSCDTKLKYSRFKFAHIWKCPSCPIIVYEYYNASDTASLNEFMERNSNTKVVGNG